jgi:hypothetical protein
MAIERRKITHFFKRPPEPDAWVLLAIIMQAKGLFYFDYSTIPVRRYENSPELARSIDDFTVERLEELSTPIEVVFDSNSKSHEGLGFLWLTPDFEVYLSTAEDPVRDPNHRLVHRWEGPK